MGNSFVLCLDANTIKEHRWFFNTKFISEAWYATHYHARSLLFKEDLFEFYEQAYNEILEGHDAEKNAYNRIFHSVKDAEDFTKVFREFCAIAYVDKVFKFTKSSFEEYFIGRLESKWFNL